MLRPQRSFVSRAALPVLASGLLLACAGPSPSATSPSAEPSATSAPTSTPEVSPSAPVPTPSPTESGPTGSGPDRLRLEEVASGLADPIGLTNAGDSSGRIFVNERGGRIRVVTAGRELLAQPFVDLSNRVAAGGERGLLGVAFHPDFETNGRLFVHYSRAGDGFGIVSELRASDDRSSADPGSERVLLSYADPYPNHNGGEIAFGPDGFLYIGWGDGGGGGDPLGNGQNRDTLLGKLLRIDVDGEPTGRPYAIPSDNPFAPDGIQPGGGEPEIWAYGLRNPWRFSFDPATGDLYIGDVGQGSYEEIDRQPADSRGGENYGWNVMEGTGCYRGGTCDQAGLVLPLAQYPHGTGGHCSVTGGYVYRGEAQPDLRGIYVFGDYCSGVVFTLNPEAERVAVKEVLASGLSISSFGVDEAGELYVVDLEAGGMYRVVVDE
jgi:glucose/arabinose dehydrogenase